MISMKKLSKKGFTLVELIAVVVVLIIIILLAVNIVKKYTLEAKIKAIKANAITYIKASNQFVVSLKDSGTDLISGQFTADELEHMGLRISGTKPDSASVVYYSSSVLYSCLVFGDYKIEYKQGKYAEPVETDESCPGHELVYGVDEEYTFDYTGDVQEFKTLISGKYKLQVWGAQGGYRSNINNGGKGGYSEGIITLNANDLLYVYVGGSGNTGGSKGGYNGGGSKQTYPGGGGATDIRVEGKTLYHRIIVAGGGGSDGSASNPGKAGGGINGITATETNYCSGGEGATQTSAGTRGSFGQGGSGAYHSDGWGGGGFGGAGGGGWYGGGGVNPDRSDDDRGGGGGSGFVYDGTNVVPDGYAVTSHYLTDAVTLIGNNNSIPTHDGLSFMTGNTGNGYAKITYIDE